SYTGGTNWMHVEMKGFPGSEAVRDLMIHPRENDLIIGTHGRSIWILDDIAALQQVSEEQLSQPATLFEPRKAMRFGSRFTRYGIGDKPFTGKNPPYGALLTYYLRNKMDPKQTVKIEVLDEQKKVIRTLDKVPHERGLNRTNWDLRYDSPAPRRPRMEDVDPETEFTGPRGGPQALPGHYTVRLVAGSTTIEKPVEVYTDPSIHITAEELRAQFEYDLKLRDLQTATNTALRTIDTLLEQVKQADGSMSALSASDDVKHALEERQKQLESIQLQLARPRDIPGYSMGPRLIDRLGALESEIDRTLAAPTPYQREYYNELQTEFVGDMGRVNTVVTKDVPEINEMLKRHNGPALMPGNAIKMPEWLSGGGGSQ
ncbi:MAG: hypothetical protein JO091_11310, partial [Acidobacteriaceae bacterium]|nr:hypothetical protein [Acidobacteriaceae bacterium]